MEKTKPKIVLAGFLKCGTKSYTKYLEEKGYDVIRLDTDLYSRFLNVPGLLWKAYGDIPIRFIVRKEMKKARKTLKRTMKRHRLKLMREEEIDYMYDTGFHYNRFYKYFSDVELVYLEDLDMNENVGKTKLIHYLIDIIPLYILKLYKDLKQLITNEYDYHLDNAKDIDEVLEFKQIKKEQIQ